VNLPNRKPDFAVYEISKLETNVHSCDSPWATKAESWRQWTVLYI